MPPTSRAPTSRAPTSRAPTAGPRLRPALADLPAYVPGLAGSGPTQVHKLSSNENPFGPLPSVLTAITREAATVNRYPDMTAAELAHAIAAHDDVDVAQIATGTGSVGVLQQAVQATAGDGDEVVFAWRSFEAYPIVAAVNGATGVPVPLTADARHDLDAMAAAVTDRTRLALLCSPNNPTGPALRRGELLAFLDSVPGDVLVVLDEAYREFVRDADVPDGVEMARDHPNLCVLRTFSKAHGLAGLRVGYGVASPEVAAALRATSVPFGVSALAQSAAITSLAASDELHERVERIVVERERVVEALRRIGWDVADPQGNFVWLAVGERTAELKAACEAAGVFVRPFASEGVRVTIGEPAANDAFLAVAADFRSR